VKTAIVVFLSFLCLYLLTLGGHLYSPDEELMFRTAQSLARRGDLAIEPLAGFASKRGIDGREYAQYGIGQPLLSVPFYYFGSLLTRVIPSAAVHRFQWDTTQYHDRSPRAVLLRFGVSIFNQMIMSLLVVAVYALCFYLTRDKIASVLTAILFGCGTMALVHAKTFFSEPLATLCALSAFYLLYRGVQERRFVFVTIAGAIAAYGVLTRLDTLLTIPGFLVLIMLGNWALFKERITTQPAGPFQFIRAQYGTAASLRSYTFFIPVVLILLLIAILNKIRFGHFLATGYEDQAEGVQFSTPMIAGLYGYLFSIGKGIFFFSPPLVLFFFSVKKFAHEYRNAAIGLLTIILVFLLVHSTWRNWTGGWCWGPRHIFLIHAFLAVPIVSLLTSPRSGSVRIAYSVLLLLGIAVQLYGASENFIDYYVEFYRTPKDPPNCYTLYSRDDSMILDQNYVLLVRDDEHQSAQQAPLWLLIAPLNDSIYIPQNSQWSGYAVMLKQRKHDFFWLHLLSPEK
jgi:hypothetical protein